jgi:hypothetical protein
LSRPIRRSLLSPFFGWPLLDMLCIGNQADSRDGAAIAKIGRRIYPRSLQDFKKMGRIDNEASVI